MKQILVIPFVLGLAALLGYGLLRVTGNHIYVREMFAALIPSVVAGMAAIAPALLQRQHGQAAVVQGAFQGMVIHMGMIGFASTSRRTWFPAKLKSSSPSATQASEAWSSYFRTMQMPR